MMGKRSDFARRPMDDYPTIDTRAVVPLLPFVEDLQFAEPCAGDGRLIAMLENEGLRCCYRGDIRDGLDAMAETTFGGCDVIITNPPWTRDILHPMIRHFQSVAPTWLLFDADWAHTKQSAPYLDQCSHIVAVGRLKWIEDSRHTGKDNCAWYRFDARHSGGAQFVGRQEQVAA